MQPRAVLLAALLLGLLVWLWAAQHSFVALDNPRLARIDLGTGAAAQRFVRDAQGQWRVASFDHVPADAAALHQLLEQAWRGRAGTGQIGLSAWDKQNSPLAQGAVSQSAARALLQRPYAPALIKPPHIRPTLLKTGLLMGEQGPKRLLSGAENQKILALLNGLKPAAIRPGSRILWREVVMLELRLAQGGRLYVQATHDGRWLWIRIAGNGAAVGASGQADMGQRFNDFRNFAYAIAPARWPATLLPSQPKCDPTLSPTPCPKPVP